MKNLQIQGIQRLSAKEMENITGGFWHYVRAAAKALAAIAAVNDLCDRCITARINSSDGSLGGSRPFE